MGAKAVVQRAPRALCGLAPLAFDLKHSMAVQCEQTQSLATGFPSGTEDVLGLASKTPDFDMCQQVWAALHPPMTAVSQRAAVGQIGTEFVWECPQDV